MYITLNLCRVLAYAREDLILSKKEGGEWGIQNLPGRYHSLLRQALEAYGSEGEMAVDKPLAADFAADMLDRIAKEALYISAGNG